MTSNCQRKIILIGIQMTDFEKKLNDIQARLAIISTLQELCDNVVNISPTLIDEVEASVKKRFFSVEEAALMILSISIKAGEIDESSLFENGKKLVDEYDKSLDGDY